MTESVAGIVYGPTISSEVGKNGKEYPAAVKIWQSMLGNYAFDDVVQLKPGPEGPVLLTQDGKTERNKKPAFFFVDRDDTLLLVVSGHRHWTAGIVGAIATSRFRSARYSTRDLDWAFFAYRRHYNHDQFRGYVLQAWRTGRLAPGLAELFLRFAKPDHKLSLLKELRSCDGLPGPMLDAVGAALYDVAPEIQSVAAHVLLDNDRRVDPAPLRATMEASAGNHMRFYCLGPLLRSGDEQAGEEMVALLNANRLDPIIIGQAAYGSADLLPLVAPAVGRRDVRSIFSWLKLGGSCERLLELSGGDVTKLNIAEAAESGTIEGLRLLLERLRVDLVGDGDKGARDWSIHDDLRYLSRLVKKLKGKREPGLVGMLRPALRGNIERSVGLPPKLQVRPRLLAILARAGDREALSELSQLPWKEATGGLLSFVADELDDVPGREAAETLASLLLRAAEGWPYDDCFEGQRTVFHITKILRRKSEADRSAALAAMRKAAPGILENRYWLYVGWALGESPADADLMRIPPAIWPADFDLRLDPANHKAVLPRLRDNIEKHWFPLAVMGDVASVPALGAWLERSVPDGRNLYWPVLALRYMRSARAAPYMYKVVPAIPQSGLKSEFFETLGEIEEPDRLTKLASMCADPDKIMSSFAAHAFLIALGRR
jgi:hypothetical protein